MKMSLQPLQGRIPQQVGFFPPRNHHVWGGAGSDGAPQCSYRRWEAAGVCLLPTAAAMPGEDWVLMGSFPLAHPRLGRVQWPQGPPGAGSSGGGARIGLGVRGGAGSRRCRACALGCREGQWEPQRGARMLRSFPPWRLRLGRSCHPWGGPPAVTACGGGGGGNGGPMGGPRHLGPMGGPRRLGPAPTPWTL